MNLHTLRDLRLFGLQERPQTVAARAGMSVATIYKAEKAQRGGLRPHPNNYHRIAKGYCISIEQLRKLLGDAK